MECKRNLWIGWDSVPELSVTLPAAEGIAMDGYHSPENICERTLQESGAGPGATRWTLCLSGQVSSLIRMDHPRLSGRVTSALVRPCQYRAWLSSVENERGFIRST